MQDRTRARTRMTLSALIVAGGAGWALSATAQTVSFKLDVLPIIENHCVKCHQPGGAGHTASGLDLRSYDGLMSGTQHGKIITPGDPLTSNLMLLIEGRANPAIRMPHNEPPLLKPQIEIVREWIKQGAKNN